MRGPWCNGRARTIVNHEFLYGNVAGIMNGRAEPPATEELNPAAVAVAVLGSVCKHTKIKLANPRRL